MPKFSKLNLNRNQIILLGFKANLKHSMITWPKPAEESRFKVYTTNFLNYVNFDFINNCLKLYYCPKNSRKSYWKVYSMFILDFLSKHKLIIFMTLSTISFFIFMYFLGKKNSWIRSKILISLKENEPIPNTQYNSLNKNPTLNQSDSIHNPTEVYEDNELNSKMHNTKTKILTNSIDRDIDKKKLEIIIDDCENKKEYDLIHKTSISTQLNDEKNLIKGTTFIEKRKEDNLDQNVALRNRSIDNEPKNRNKEDVKEFKAEKETENNGFINFYQNSIESSIEKSYECKDEHRNKENYQNLKSNIPFRAPFRSSLIKNWEICSKNDRPEIKPVKINNKQMDVKIINQKNITNYYFDKIDNFSY